MGVNIWEGNKAERLAKALETVAEGIGNVLTPEAIAGDVSNWLEENVSGGETILVDNSLTISGAAADAKKVGDEISAVNGALTDSQLTNPTRVENYYCHYTGGTITSNGSYGYIQATGIGAYKAIHVKTNLPNGAPSICFYKANGDWISSLKAPESSSPYLYDAVLSVPNGADIIRVSCLKANLNSASVNTTLKEMLSGINDAIETVLSTSIDLPLTGNATANDRIAEMLVLKQPVSTSHAYMTISASASQVLLHDGEDRIGILQIADRFAINTVYEIKNGNNIVGLVMFKVNANMSQADVMLTDAVFNTTRNSNLYTYFLESNGIYNLPEYIGEHGAGGLSGVSLGGNPVTVTDKIANIPAASAIADGYMSKEDKQKLNNIVNPGSVTIEGSGVTKNASAYGFLPTNDGVTNATNLQTAINDLGGGTILVDYPGIYEISRTITVPSNTALVFGENVYIKRTKDSDNKFGRYVFINAGAINGTSNENITIRNLRILPNGNLDTGNTPDIAQPEIGMRGLVVMVRIKNLIIDGLEVVDLNFVQYAAQISFFENVRVENVRVETSKDGLHFGTGNGFIVRNCYFMTNDDPIALNAVDYPASNIGIGDITDGIIENIYLLAPPASAGFNRTRGMLMLSGAWKNWESGNTYRKYGDLCVNNGVLYQSLSPQGPTTDTLVSTVAPTHQSGAQMYSDGLQWLAKQNLAVLSANIKNVTFRNIYAYRNVTCLFMILSSESSYLRSIYPGAEIVPNENITFDNVHFLYEDQTKADSLVLIYNETTNIVAKDSIFDKVTDLIVFKNDAAEYPSNAKANVSLIGNYYGFGGKVFKGISSSKKPTVTASICGSMKSSEFIYGNENATVTTLMNDIS